MIGRHLVNLQKHAVAILLFLSGSGIAISVAVPQASYAVNSGQEAQFNLACEDVKSNHYADAHKKLKTLARQDHLKSLTLLGLLYERGLGAEKNANRAFDCYARAATKGLPEAESRLGHLMLDTGKTIQSDSKNAQHWIQQAATHGVAEAQATLGRLYFEGKHVQGSNSEAVRWLRQAADQGHEKASEMLSSIPQLQEANNRFHEAGNQYSTGMGNLEKSWVGYADIVNSVNKASNYQYGH